MRAMVTTIFVLMLAVTGRPPVLASAEGTDPASVVAAFDAALNAGDVEATLALFSDDAVVRTQTATHTGKEQVRRLFQELVADRFQFESSNRRVLGDTETHAAKVSRDEWRRLGIVPLDASAEVVVQEGKIRSFTVTYSAESLARLQAAQARAAPSQLPRALPRTGEHTAAAGEVGALAVLAALVGLTVRQRRA
jgi:hypothetical protein